MQMTHYEEDDKGIILHFDRGQPSVHTKVLVGADGYFSKVRAQCLGDGPPTFNVSSLLLLTFTSALFPDIDAYCTMQQCHQEPPSMLKGFECCCHTQNCNVNNRPASLPLLTKKWYPPLVPQNILHIFS